MVSIETQSLPVCSFPLPPPSSLLPETLKILLRPLLSHPKTFLKDFTVKEQLPVKGENGDQCSHFSSSELTCMAFLQGKHKHGRILHLSILYYQLWKLYPIYSLIIFHICMQMSDFFKEYYFFFIGKFSWSLSIAVSTAEWLSVIWNGL